MTKDRALKFAVVIVVVAATVAMATLGGADALRDQDRIETFLTDSGPIGPLAYVLGFVALQPLSLPGAVLIVPATFVWSWWEVALYSLAGGMLASSVGFALARWLARDWVEARLPARLLPWRQRLRDHELPTVVALRLVTGYAPAADWLLGVSPVRVSAFLLGTLLGLMPGTVALSIWGDDAVRGISDAPLLGALVAGAVALGIWVLYLLRQRVLRRRRP